jgi:hypothetical protein
MLAQDAVPRLFLGTSAAEAQYLAEVQIMPAPWNAGAVARIVGEMHGSQVINVIHFATNAQINDDDNLDDVLLELAQALLECAITTLLPAVSSDYRLIQCDAKRIHPVASDPIVATAPAGSVGELGVASASFIATLVNVRTGGGGKRGRGRMFLPPAGETETQQSQIDGPTMALVAAFLTCLAGKFLGANATTAWRLGVFSTKQFKELAGGGFDNAFRVATSLNPKQDVACMRSRKKGHGA